MLDGRGTWQYHAVNVLLPSLWTEGVGGVSKAFASILRGAGLTGAEQRVLHLVLEGYTTRQIADELVLSEATVRTHLTHIYRKLKVRGKVQLLARTAGLLDGSGEAGSPATSKTAP